MTQLASLPGVIRTILIILLVYYGIKIIARLLAPYLLRHLSKSAEKRFGQQFDDFGPTYEKKKEGETIIDKMPSKNKSSDKEVGEYIDYEEID
ncbi:MAG: DUF4834 family protein [Flavobacteriaceae bacterium]|nr:DUF4834 family protein [Flavobacteriaceae bacterium]